MNNRFYEKQGHEILECEVKGNGKICTGIAFVINIHATFENGILHAEYRYPNIEGTEWQGQIIENEQRPMYLHYGDQSVEIPVTNGVAEEQIEFPAPGTYQLRVDMGEGVGCEPAELEVVIE